MSDKHEQLNVDVLQTYIPIVVCLPHVQQDDGYTAALLSCSTARLFSYPDPIVNDIKHIST